MKRSESNTALRTFRLVCEPDQRPLVEELLRAEGFEFHCLDLHPSCRRLSVAPFALGASLAAQFGLIYIQDQSSLLPPLALCPQPGETVLDLCASPGSKAGLAAQLVGGDGLILANEPTAKRHQTLRRNMELLNLFQVCTSSANGQTLPAPAQLFDKVLLDVPCSGWGTVEKNPKVTRIWREEKLGPLIGLQRQLLGRAAELLAPGGRLVYSTCTTNPRENEEQVAWARENTALGCVRLFPAKGCRFEDTDQNLAPGSLLVDGPASGGQSFFLACLTKPGPKPTEPGVDLPTEPAPMDIQTVPSDPEPDWSRLPAGRLEQDRGRVFFRPDKASQELGRTLAWKGLSLGKTAGGGLLPDAGLRLLLPDEPGKDGLQVEETSVLRSLLSGQSLTADSHSKRLGLYWRGLPLGWLTVKGRRALWSGRTMS